MEGLAAFDGGRSLKAGLLAFGALIWTAPVFAQPVDPLAPLPAPEPKTEPAQQPQAQPQAPRAGVINTPTYPPPQAAFSLPGPVQQPVNAVGDRKSTRLNSSHVSESRMP